MALYYESAGVILTLITLGKYFEAVSKENLRCDKKLMGLAPKLLIFYVMAQKLKCQLMLFSWMTL